jgi:RimJ/RimL family protein N-acetyltransferase
MTRPVVLARELTDLPDQVRAVPAPTTPHVDAPFALRPVDPASTDPELVAHWMSLPHLVQTWEQPWTAERWRADSAVRLAGQYSRPYLLEADLRALGVADEGMRPVGYLELYRVAKDECARLYDVDPWDVGLHIATGDPRLIGRGVMSGLLGSLARAIWTSEPRCGRIVADPDHRNARMRAALSRQGFRCLGEFDVRADRRIGLYARDR